MTAAVARRSLRGTPRRELILVLLLGAAGAGLVLLATRQGWADVETAAPRPLPAGVTTESGQALAPAASALAVAALAGLAAVLATRRTLRRVAGVVLAGFGAGIAVAVSAGISAADVLAAESGSASSQAAAGASAAGSTTGSTAGAGAAPLPGFPSHVVFTGFPWRPIAVAGAIAVIAAGALVAWRAERLPVMSARFERPAQVAGTRVPGPAGPQTERGSQGGRQRGPERGDSAAMWESLSRGEDPTGPAEERDSQRRPG
jgi:uncharacterized membrane protein (TIGR02234 family)